jgi:hypothetical protein
LKNAKLQAHGKPEADRVCLFAKTICTVSTTPSPLTALAHRLATTAGVVVAFLVVVVGLVPLLHRLVDAYGQHRLSDALFANDLKGAQRALKRLYTMRGLSSFWG